MCRARSCFVMRYYDIYMYRDTHICYVWKMCDVFVKLSELSELSCLVKRPLPLPLPCWLGSASQRSEPKDWSGQHGERRGAQGARAVR